MRALLLTVAAAVFCALPVAAQTPPPPTAPPIEPAPVVPPIPLQPAPQPPGPAPGPPELGQTAPPAPPEEMRPTIPGQELLPWPPMLIPQEDADPAERLDTLFADLQAAPDADAAQRIERRIVITMNDAGSETINLLMNWVNEAIMEDEYPMALDLLDSVILLAPDYVDGWNKRATVHYRMGDFGLALDDLEQTLVLEPRHFQAIAGLGIILRELDRPDQAIVAFRAALAIHPFLEGVEDAIADLEEGIGRDI